jgi:hypothetical protein
MHFLSLYILFTWNTEQTEQVATEWVPKLQEIPTPAHLPVSARPTTAFTVQRKEEKRSF